jgi:hypothetical protein
MRYILTGFSHHEGFRIFTFEGIASDRAQAVFTVKVDLSLLRQHGIPLQDLPLLCRGVLERRPGDDECRAYTYTESEMSLRAEASAVPSSRRRKVPRGNSSRTGAQTELAPAPAGEDPDLEAAIYVSPPMSALQID